MLRDKLDVHLFFRSVDLEFTNESSYEGIDCYEYRIPDWALQNVTNNPTNVAYYAWKYSGMLNLTACAQNGESPLA